MTTVATACNCHGVMDHVVPSRLIRHRPRLLLATVWLDAASFEVVNGLDRTVRDGQSTSPRMPISLGRLLWPHAGASFSCHSPATVTKPRFMASKGGCVAVAVIGPESELEGPGGRGHEYSRKTARSMSVGESSQKEIAEIHAAAFAL